MMTCKRSCEFAKYFLVLGLFSLGTLSGCGSNDQFDTFKAEGTVTLNDKPLVDAHVWLLPKAKNHQDAVLVVRPQGRTGSDGKFKLTTYLQDDGAPEGEYDAIVLHGANDPDDGDEEPQAPTKKIAVPMKYKDAKTSGLLVTIKKGETNALPLNLKTK